MRGPRRLYTERDRVCARCRWECQRAARPPAPKGERENLSHSVAYVAYVAYSVQIAGQKSQTAPPAPFRVRGPPMHHPPPSWAPGNAPATRNQKSRPEPHFRALAGHVTIRNSTVRTSRFRPKPRELHKPDQSTAAQRSATVKTQVILNFRPNVSKRASLAQPDPNPP